MGLTLLFVFVLGLFLLPITYYLRTRRQWWQRLCAEGTPATATIVDLKRLPKQRHDGQWFAVTFEFSIPEHEGTLRSAVSVRPADVQAAGLHIGMEVRIRHYTLVPTEAALADVYCEPYGT
jgi:hypothetical protein